jgi:hypothetical protein
MPKQKSPKTDVFDRQTRRIKQYDEMELLLAASEVDIMCVGGLFDRYLGDERLTS